jgi:ArsR family transcriptional regulator, cadmium/lead-responsive transcriptional repressor
MRQPQAKATVPVAVFRQDCGLVERERRGRETHYRLVDGLNDVLTAADRVLERTGDRVMACPRYGTLAARREAA